MKEYKEIEWNRGTRNGIRFNISLEDYSLIDSKLELLGWKISYDLQIDEWWKNIKSFLPPWSSYNQSSSSKIYFSLSILLFILLFSFS